MLETIRNEVEGLHVNSMHYHLIFILGSLSVLLINKEFECFVFGFVFVILFFIFLSGPAANNQTCRDPTVNRHRYFASKENL